MTPTRNICDKLHTAACPFLWWDFYLQHAGTATKSWGRVGKIIKPEITHLSISAELAQLKCCVKVAGVGKGHQLLQVGILKRNKSRALHKARCCLQARGDRGASVGRRRNGWCAEMSSGERPWGTCPWAGTWAPQKLFPVMPSSPPCCWLCDALRSCP